MKTYSTLALALCTLLIGCGDPETAPPGDKEPVAAAPVSHPLPGDPAAGMEVYNRICVACHQADGSGLNGMLAANFVGDASRLAKPNEELIESIKNGIISENRVMPPQKDVLTEKEIKDALSYIRQTFGSK